MMFEQNNSFTVPSIVREEGDVVLHRAEFDDFIKYQIVIEIYAMTNGARATKTKSISTLNNFFSGSEGLTFLPRGGLRIWLRSRPIDRSERIMRNSKGGGKEYLGSKRLHNSRAICAENQGRKNVRQSRERRNGRKEGRTDARVRS